MATLNNFERRLVNFGKVECIIFFHKGIAFIMDWLTIKYPMAGVMTEGVS